MYTVTWQPSAAQQLQGLPRKVQSRILAATSALTQQPRPRGAAKLRGKLRGLYRVRVGIHYRVVYSIDDKRNEVLIEHVASREDIY